MLPKQIAAAAVVALSLAGLAPAAADPWAAAGSPSRPTWVHPNAERRLRLLAGLPGIAATISGEAQAYFS